MQTALADEDGEAFVSSELFANGTNIFWSKLYQGKFLKNITIKILDSNKNEWLKILKLLPRNLNSYTLTLDLSGCKLNEQNIFLLKNFKNGKICITNASMIKNIQFIDCLAPIIFNITDTAELYFVRIFNCKLIRFFNGTYKLKSVPVSGELYSIINSKLIFKNTKLYQIDDTVPILLASASYIFIDKTNTLYSNNNVQCTALTPSLFVLNECQSTILPAGIWENSSTDDLNKFFENINGLAQVSNKFNLINHIHTFNNISNKNLVPAGTRILYPAVTNTTIGTNGSVTNQTNKLLINIPQGWSLVTTNNILINSNAVVAEDIAKNYLYYYTKPKLNTNFADIILTKKIYGKWDNNMSKPMKFNSAYEFDPWGGRQHAKNNFTICVEISLTCSKTEFNKDKSTYLSLLNSISIPSIQAYFWGDGRRGSGGAGYWAFKSPMYCRANPTTGNLLTGVSKEYNYITNVTDAKHNINGQTLEYMSKWSNGNDDPGATTHTFTGLNNLSSVS
jgi:hypothetical protein